MFHHGGEDLIYLSSADWMQRNLSGRVETAFPIIDESLKEEITKIMQIQWNDNTKARSLQYKHINEYVRHEVDFPVRSQIETFFFIKRKEELSQNQEN